MAATTELFQHWFVYTDEHPFDYGFGLFTEGSGFSDAIAACFQIDEDGKIARQVVAITYALASHQTLGSTRFCGRESPPFR